MPSTGVRDGHCAFALIVFVAFLGRKLGAHRLQHFELVVVPGALVQELRLVSVGVLTCQAHNARHGLKRTAHASYSEQKPGRSTEEKREYRTCTCLPLIGSLNTADPIALPAENNRKKGERTAQVLRQL
jgi:hypothetical protein